MERVANTSLPQSCDPPARDLGWQRILFDLGGYRCTRVTLRIVLRSTDSWYNTWAYIDDVQVVP